MILPSHAPPSSPCPSPSPSSEAVSAERGKGNFVDALGGRLPRATIAIPHLCCLVLAAGGQPLPLPLALALAKDVVQAEGLEIDAEAH